MDEETKIKYEDLLHKYKLLEDLMEHIPDVIYFKDRKGRLIMVNQAHAKGLNLAPEEVIGKTDFDIHPRTLAEKMTNDDLYVMKTGKPIVDKIERATRPDGVDNYVSTTKIPRYDEKGNIVGIIGITRDITHRMQIDRLRDEKREVEKRLEASEEMNKMKSEFISIVSHELRTPLAIAKEAVSLIFEKVAGAVNNKQKKLLLRAKDNLSRLNNMIEELLDISRIESGKFRLHYSLISINGLATDSSAFFKRIAKEKGINLRYDLPKREVNIFVDGLRINQVISNLINNALKFTEEDGMVKVEARVSDDKVRIGIIDTGVGIAKSDLARIFDKFIQISTASGAEKKGIGLGLSIVKDLVERHGGEIWAESKPGVGSRFYFTLPRFCSASAAASKETKEAINNLLDVTSSTYLINVSLVNYDRLMKKIRTDEKGLLGDLEKVLSPVCESAWREMDGRLPTLNDLKKGEFVFLFPQITQKRAERLCAAFSTRLNSYFVKKKIKDLFVNFGITSYPFLADAAHLEQPPSNLRVKKIHVGINIRRHKRMIYKTELEIILPKDKREPSHTIDISKGGVSFVSRTHFAKDSRLDFKIKFPDEERPIYTKARVAWIKGIETQGGGEEDYKYRGGAEFIDLKKRDKKILSRIVSSLRP